MSHEPTTHAHHDEETHDEKKKNGLHPLIVLVAVIIIFLLIWKLIPEDNSPKNVSNPQRSEVLQTQDTYPMIDPQTFNITDSFSEKKVIRDNYFVSFVCDQPYQIRKANGALVDCEANKCASIGVKAAEESTENSILEFRTTNKSTTTMTLIFTPMKVKQ